MMILIYMPMALPTEKNQNKNKNKNKNKSKSSSTSNMDEIEVFWRRFGDEQSTLLDQFERLSFEVQLNHAILRRSLSEPSVAARVRQGRRGSGFGKVFKKLLKPILIKKGKNKNNSSSSNGGKKEVPDPKNRKYYKAFSRSLRF